MSQGSLAPVAAKTQVSTSGGAPSSGNPVPSICTDSTSPTWLAPESGPKHIGKVHALYLKINRAFWKTQSKIGVEVPVVSIYSWDVAIFCCTFDLLQKRKGSLEVTQGWISAALATRQLSGAVVKSHTKAITQTLPTWLYRTALVRAAVLCCELGQEVKSHLWRDWYH